MFTFRSIAGKGQCFLFHGLTIDQCKTHGRCSVTTFCNPYYVTVLEFSDVLTCCFGASQPWDFSNTTGVSIMRSCCSTVQLVHFSLLGSSSIMSRDLTHMLLVANLGQYKIRQKKLKYDWNPSTWVLIWEYSVRAIQWIPTLRHEWVNLSKCWDYFRPKHKDAVIVENHLNPVTLVFIR